MNEWDILDDLMADEQRNQDDAPQHVKAEQVCFGDLNYYVISDVLKFLCLKDLVRLERVSKVFAATIRSLTVNIKPDEFHDLSDSEAGRAYLNVVINFDKLRTFSFNMLSRRSRLDLKNPASRRMFCSDLADRKPSIEQFADLQFDQHDDAEKLKSVIMYCNDVNAKYGQNSISRFKFNYKTLVRHPELLSQALDLSSKLKSVKVLTELYAVSTASHQVVEEECHTVLQLWKSIGSKLESLSLGHYFSATHDRGYFKLPVEQFVNLEHLTVNILPVSYVEQIATNCSKLKSFTFCSVVESLKHLCQLNQISKLHFRPTGGYITGIRTKESLDEVLNMFFKSQPNLKILFFGQHLGILRLSSMVFETVQQCQKLEHLTLDMPLNDIIKEQFKMRSLESLQIQGPQVDVLTVTKVFKSCPKLKVLKDPFKHIRRQYEHRINLLDST